MNTTVTRRGFLGSIAAAASVAPAANNNRPNILLILADDLGYSDIGCYGSEIATPNLDQLAKGGLRFTQFYNCARCCPTRASLMTGLYPQQAGVGHMVEDRHLPAYRGDLSSNAVTIAEVMQAGGYQTWMAGKWHVTPVNDSKHNWPRQRGYQKFYGTITGAGSFYDPVTLVRENDYVKPDKPNYYYTDALSDQAATWISDRKPDDKPFFLYLAYTSPHWPLHALEADIAKYRGRYKDGWDALRQERHKRMIDMGLVKKDWPITPRDKDVPEWKDEPNKEWMQQRMEVYAAQVDRMDQGIGRVVESLRRSGQLENTLIFFLADNGGCAENLADRGPRPIYIPEKAPDGRPVRRGNDKSITPGGPDTYQSYGIGWANASNTPFRLYKHWVHEGGISTPLIAHWPKGIRKRGLTQEPGHLIDIMATCADVGGAKYPATFNGKPITPLEGRSLAPIFTTGKRTPHPAIFWEHEGNRAVRQGRWKLVAKWPGKWELYDLEADRTELHDLAAANPAKAAELEKLWNEWGRKVQAEPWDKVTRS